MAADILSLSKARKTKAKAAKEAKAAENRVLFGRTKAERQTETAKAAREQRLLDGHRRGMSMRDPEEK
jgi:Domain of unknown function (DUF4169)